MIVLMRTGSLKQVFTETEINDYRMMVILETRCPQMKDRAMVS